MNQTHATNLTKILNEIEPGIALTITSRIPDSSSLAKDFRDGKRSERVAVSVDMLSTGYNCKPLLNVVLMRPIFSPTEYIQIKGRGTRRYTFRIGNTAFEKDNFYLLDFCGVCEYFEEKYDYSIPLKLPRPHVREATGGDASTAREEQTEYDAYKDSGGDTSRPPAPREIPVWEGVDIIKTEEVRIIGPNGEKVDVMTYRGSFERDLKTFAEKQPDFKRAVEVEDDDSVETIMQERFFHRPEMFYSTDKLIKSYGVPAPAPAFAYKALGKKPLPTRENIIADAVDSIAARFNLRYKEQKWLNAIAQLITDDPTAMKQFLQGDVHLFDSSMFNPLGGLHALIEFTERERVFETLRQSSLVRYSSMGAN